MTRLGRVAAIVLLLAGPLTPMGASAQPATTPRIGWLGAGGSDSSVRSFVLHGRGA